VHEEKQGCWICQEHTNLLCACCHEQRETTKILEQEWDEQEALTYDLKPKTPICNVTATAIWLFPETEKATSTPEVMSKA
jgi:hypothetical protein